jgi:3-dehydroquinate synthase
VAKTGDGSSGESVVRVVRVKLAGRSYQIRIGTGLIDGVGRTVAAACAPSTAFIVTDRHVKPLYAERVARSLDAAGLRHHTITVRPGEKSKSAGALARVWDELLANGCDRKSAIVALGGGVVGDLAGLAASTVLRGVPVVQVPTTLLAQVDSSIGGKTGIDRPHGKNLVGTFWQPSAVEIDPAALSTLPDRELRAGLAEVVKAGVIRSERLFDLVERRAEPILHCDPGVLAEVIELSCKVKAKVVGSDERDTSGERAVLNFGHTVGHALEAAAGFDRLLHGEAVALGMIAAGRIALKLGLWRAEAQDRMEKLLARLGLPQDLGGLDLKDDAVIDLLKSDKKTVSGQVYFVLPESIGYAALHPKPVDLALVREVVGTLRVKNA